MMVVLAMPPASHMVWRPYFAPDRPMAWSIVVMIRAPEAPSGCPSAMAPPQGLSFASSSSPKSLAQDMGTGAKASFTSIWSRSAAFIPARSSALREEGIGAVSISSGLSPRTS